MLHEEPHSNDVLCGRGQVINAHPGNVHFRSIVNHLKLEYVMSKKADKKVFANVIVESIRSRNPPGRFLKQDKETKLWYDVGDKVALGKTRQALREGAPIIEDRLRKRLEQPKQPNHHQLLNSQALVVEGQSHRSQNQTLSEEKGQQNQANEDCLQVSDDNTWVKSLSNFPNTFSTLGPLKAKRMSFNANVA